MDELQKENEELKSQVENLRKKLRDAYLTIDQLKKSIARQYRYNQDYVPYPDEDDRR
jgi:chaperonin cofactor prefoldin